MAGVSEFFERAVGRARDTGNGAADAVHGIGARVEGEARSTANRPRDAAAVFTAEITRPVREAEQAAALAGKIALWSLKVAAGAVVAYKARRWWAGR